MGSSKNLHMSALCGDREYFLSINNKRKHLLTNTCCYET